MKILKKKKKKKKNFFLRLGIFFFKLGKKSPKSHWERGRISAPEDTKKNPCIHNNDVENEVDIHVFSAVEKLFLTHYH